MADSSYEKGLTELSKMKVADLRAELKQRGLSTAGNKNELVERLQLAIHGDAALSLDETTEEILDEDEVLGDEEIEELSSKPDSQETPEKRKLSIDNITNNSNAKKIVLNRKSVLEEIKNDQMEKKENKGVKVIESDDAPPEKKIIKLSELSTKERLEMRAKKFGMPLSEAAKKEARLARFNVNNQNNKSAASIKTPVPTTYEVLKKRAERFGTSVSTLMEKVEMAERLEKRKARFGEVKPENKLSKNNSKIKINESLTISQSCSDLYNYKELDKQNTQEAIFYKRLIAILLSKLKMQEAEIKLMAAQAKYREMPIACQPHKMNFLDRMTEWLLPTNNCEKYYETIMTNPRLQVTPALVLTHLFTTVIFQPLTYFGLIISEFIDNATSKLNFLYKFLITIALFLSICICIILIPFSWIGGSINFGFGPFFRFGMKGRQNSNQNQGDRIERIYEEVSPKRRLKDSGKMKQNMLRQNNGNAKENNLAGGDADMHHLVRYKKCQCERKTNGDIECTKKEEKLLP
ncbi:SAP domain-containing ribonucleoprotein [Atta colombica]|uniref:Chloride channel CLIC-like protein 1 n=1 Tax=Atta colombica TaxID=520822 RepID=A0A151I2G5_9HYME|nr:SAP domain-containing ribonucleoprotein [Atta colombica]